MSLSSGNTVVGSAIRQAPLSLSADITTSFRIDVVPGLFEYGNDALPDAWEQARRLVVAWDDTAGDRSILLRSYLDAAVTSGLLDDFIVVEQSDIACGGLAACGEVVKSAIKVGLERRDAFVAFGDEGVSQMVAVAAASFRRHTRAVRLHRNLTAVVATLRDGDRTGLMDHPISALQRSTRVLVDADGVLTAGPMAAGESAALLLLALLDRQVLAQLGDHETSRHRAEGLSAVLRLSHRIGPGHPAWRIGEDLLPLAPRGMAVAERRVWSMLLTAGVSHRLGLLGDDVIRELDAVAARWYPALPGPSTAAADASAVGGWPGPGLGADGRSVTICLLATGNATQVTIDRAVLDTALTRGSAGHGPLAASTRMSRQDPPAAQVEATARTDGTTLVSFPVRFTDDLLDPGGAALADLLPSQCRVLAIVDPYRHGQLRRVHNLLAGYRERGYVSGFSLLPLAASSRAKTLEQVCLVFEEAEKLGLTATDRLVVVGGGTVMDIVGYAAYLYRGLTPYIRVPTTLVGMIDAGVGLKVGVNLSDHKNLLGAYHPPLACVCDVSFLKTLPVPERRCGIAEAIKISAVCDAALFARIETHRADLLAGRDTPQVRAILGGSISAMLRQLEANPVEANLRRLPDFGHEFGHMLESLTRYRLRHGEAVAIGMALSSWLAAALGYLPQAQLHRLLRLLADSGLPLYDRACDPGVLWRKLNDDVLPHKAGQLHLVVPREIGTGGFIDSIDEISADLLADACQALRGWHYGARP